MYNKQNFQQVGNNNHYQYDNATKHQQIIVHIGITDPVYSSSSDLSGKLSDFLDRSHESQTTMDFSGANSLVQLWFVPFKVSIPK